MDGAVLFSPFPLAILREIGYNIKDIISHSILLRKEFLT
jgi:hypothetical protein